MPACSVCNVPCGMFDQPTAWQVKGRWRCTAHRDYNPPPKKELRNLKGFCQYCGVPIVMDKFSPKRNCYNCTLAIANLTAKAKRMKKKDGIKRKVVYTDG